MKPTKRNNFFNFIFSFLPGASEMYMGFLKNGFSIMAVFFMACGLVAITGLDFMMVVVALAWFYGFFHARNLCKLDDESFRNFQDVYVWEEFDTNKALNIPVSKVRTVGAVILILMGLAIIWDYATEIIYNFIPGDYWDFLYPIINDIPSVVIAIALIAVGVMLVSGKKKELVMPQNAADVVASHVFIAKEETKEDNAESKQA
ncbi:hypothetical protein [Butyrivibrio sp. VCB2006]|uniref:hypothetical protein n=1 Tax=Butyrivibrio sp. VCB2006 TaxID=1280679 RepID=UPI0004297EBB|nr:hypothetical protein [Butyrivibrio sp. VCB2006]